jgi:hypothetical protein
MARSASTNVNEGGLHPPGRLDPDFSFHRRIVSEETPLLAAATDVPYHHHRSSSPDETFRDDELEEQEIEPEEFDRMLQRSTSFTSGLGIEPECQESSMLRGPRRYSRSRGRRASTASGRRRSVASGHNWDDEAVVEEDEEDKTENQYLGGVSVGRFWLIYAGILANLVTIHSIPSRIYADGCDSL